MNHENRHYLENNHGKVTCEFCFTTVAIFFFREFGDRAPFLLFFFFLTVPQRVVNKAC